MSVEIIGALYDPPPEEGGTPVRLWGYHVNVTPDVLERNAHLASAVQTPSLMRRVWAGDDPASPVLTIPLRFNGEAAALAALDGLA